MSILPEGVTDSYQRNLVDSESGQPVSGHDFLRPAPYAGRLGQPAIYSPLFEPNPRLGSQQFSTENACQVTRDDGPALFAVDTAGIVSRSVSWFPVLVAGHRMIDRLGPVAGIGLEGVPHPENRHHFRVGVFSSEQLLRSLTAPMLSAT